MGTIEINMVRLTSTLALSLGLAGGLMMLSGCLAVPFQDQTVETVIPEQGPPVSELLQRRAGSEGPNSEMLQAALMGKGKHKGIFEQGECAVDTGKPSGC